MRMKTCLVVGAATLTSSLAVAAEMQTTFKNSGAEIRYVFAFEGPDSTETEPCKDKKSALPILGIGAKQERQAKFYTGTTICYGIAVSDDASKPPYFTGVAKAGESVDVATPSFDASGSARANLMSTGGTPKYEWPIGSFPRPFPSFRPVYPIPVVPNAVGVEATVAIWRDPLTPPHTRTRCTSEAWGEYWPGGPQWRTCNAYATDCQWMERRLILTVRVTAAGMTEAKARAAVDDCLRTAAVAGSLTGLVAAYTGGAGVAAAEAAFAATLKICLLNKLTDSVIDIQLRNDGGWTDWAAC